MSRNPRSPTPGHLDGPPTYSLGTTLKVTFVLSLSVAGSVLATSFPVAALLGAALLLVGSGLRGKLWDRPAGELIEDGRTGDLTVPFTDVRVETRVYRES